MARPNETYRGARRNAYRDCGILACWCRETRYSQSGWRDDAVIHQSYLDVLKRIEAAKQAKQAALRPSING